MLVWLSAVAVAGLALWVFWRYVYFFRDPERTIPPGKNVVAPADGKIMYIHKVSGNMVPISIKGQREIPLTELLKAEDTGAGERYVVGIFMSPFDVHVNRAPIAGEVVAIHYHESRNRVMTLTWLRCLFGLRPYEKHAQHILENERNTTVIRGDFPVVVVQIADRYVRKIVCSLREHQRVEKGQRMGLIRMGSQVDCIFPQENMTLRAEVGQAARAGETILASYD